MAGDPAQELYQRFEIEVRTPKRRLLIDALLPDPSTIPSSLPVVQAPPPVAAEDLGFLGRDRIADRDPEPGEERPRPRKKAKPAPARRKEGPKSLEEEVAEFMNRDRPSALAPDVDEPGPGRGSTSGSSSSSDPSSS